MASSVRSLVSPDGQALGSVIDPEMLAKLFRLVGMILSDALGAPTDFEADPARAVLVTYGYHPDLLWLLCVVVDPVHQRVELHLPGETAIVIDPLTEPRFRLARKVRQFLEAVRQRKASLELGGDGPYKPRRLGVANARLRGHFNTISYVMESTPGTPAETAPSGERPGP